MFGIGYETSYPILMFNVTSRAFGKRSLTERSALRNDPSKFKSNEEQTPFLLAVICGVYTRSCEQARAAIAPISSVEISTS
jgi:hypothetical protein